MMSRRHLAQLVTVCVIILAGFAPAAGGSLRAMAAFGNGQARPQRTPAYLVREVRHQLLLLPYYSIFDNIEYQVRGYTVELLGEVVRPSLKSEAENVVRHIEGVEKVIDHIKVLPPSPSDDRIRLAEYRAIYGYPALNKYALQAVGPIHIIVDNGRVTLEGVVDNQGDKNIAGIRANGVPGVFSVANHLRVQSGKV
jgi:hyperosmotically inducible protein